MKQPTRSTGAGADGYALAITDPDGPKLWQCTNSSGLWTDYCDWRYWTHGNLCDPCTRWRHRSLPAPMIVRAEEDHFTDETRVILLYQECAVKLWSLFETDPIPDSHAHTWCDRLKALVDRKLLVPSGTSVAVTELEESRLVVQGLNAACDQLRAEVAQVNRKADMLHKFLKRAKSYIQAGLEQCEE